MSQPSRNQRAQRERNGDNRDRDPRSRRDGPNDRRSSSERSSSQPPFYPRNAQRSVRSAPPEQRRESKCAHICSRTGIVLLCSILTNALVLVCVVAAHMSQMGMSAMSMSGGNFIDAMIPFEGTELQKVRELDMQFSQMRSPLVYGGVAFSLTFGVLSLLFVVSGNKPAHRLPRKILIGQFAFQIIGAVAYVIAIGLYLHFVIYVNSTDMCLQRERLYARNGYTWMNCSVNGGDASVALFGIITAVLYGAGTVLTGKTIQEVRSYFKERDQYNAERREESRGPQERTVNSDLYV
ncbi:hypothetical protein R3I94_015241 [Phoxinus phoxinus]